MAPGPKKKIKKKPGCHAVFGKVNIIPVVKGQLFWNRTWDYYSRARIAPVKTALSNCKVEYVYQTGPHKFYGILSDTDENGNFEFRNVGAMNARLEIILEDKDSWIVRVLGYRTKKVGPKPKFWIRKGLPITGKIKLDPKELKNNPTTLNVEIKHQRFKMLCDFYKNILDAHATFRELAGVFVRRVDAWYPRKKTDGGAFQSGTGIIFPHNRITSLSVILHEYGHFIIDHHVGTPEKMGSYDYQCANATPDSHHEHSKEFRERSWSEGVATFIGSSIADDSRYYNRYLDFTDDLFKFKDKDKVDKGDHVEGSVGGALWWLYKHWHADFKDMWEAMEGESWWKDRPSFTIWDFYDSCKRLGKLDMVHVQEAFRLHGMEYRWDFLTGEDMFECLPERVWCMKCQGKGVIGVIKWSRCPTCKGRGDVSFDNGRKIFMTVEDLYENLGKAGGGKIEEYKEEFYNRNNEFHKFNPWKPGSTYLNPVPAPLYKFIVPVRKKAW